MVGKNKPQTNAPYGNTYYPNGRSHPNLSWRPQPPVYVPPGEQHQQAPMSSTVEQAILNMSKVVGNFVDEQKGNNAQLNKKIEKCRKLLEQENIWDGK